MTEAEELALLLKREAAEREAERVYRNALHDYNDGIRRARLAYDAAMDVAENEWKAALECEPA